MAQRASTRGRRSTVHVAAQAAAAVMADESTSALCTDQAHETTTANPWLTPPVTAATMADESTAGCRRFNRVAHAAPDRVSCRLSHNLNQPARAHNHNQQLQQRDTDLVDADFEYPPYADEHPESSDKLTLVFILNNSAGVPPRVSTSVLRAEGSHMFQSYATSSIAEPRGRARGRSRSYDTKERASSTDGLTMTNRLGARPQDARAEEAVTSVRQDMRMSSPTTERHSIAADLAHGTAATAAADVEQSKLDKKRGRMCKTDGCENYIVHRGLCCRHGGGKKCSIEGCSTSAKHMGLCWRHGGSTECDIDGCTKRAKARRRCWAHGGGTKCGNAECDKVAVSGGFCWAHGGGKRCNFDDCNKPAYERTRNFCAKHHAEMQHVNYFEV